MQSRTRQQLRWVAAGATGTVATMLVIGLAILSGVASTIPVVLSHLASLCVPVAVAVAMLRYRLWDLDRLVSRTVTYALVTALLVIPHVLIVPATGRLAAGSGSLTVAAATLAAAAVFQPLRHRIQRTVDRRFNRRKYNAAYTMAEFSSRLREELDLDTLSVELLTVVEQTMQPTQASRWLRPSAQASPTSRERAS